MSDLIKAKAWLSEGEYTCVLCRKEQVETSTLRGVSPLLTLCQAGAELVGFSAADRVVGRATAFLYVRLGVVALYARVISKSALAVLEAHGIFVEYDTLAEYIINRQGDGMCPFEEAVLETEDPEEAYAIIQHKMKQMKGAS